MNFLICMDVEIYLDTLKGKLIVIKKKAQRRKLRVNSIFTTSFIFSFNYQRWKLRWKTKNCFALGEVSWWRDTCLSFVIQWNVECICRIKGHACCVQRTETSCNVEPCESSWKALCSLSSFWRVFFGEFLYDNEVLM